MNTNLTTKQKRALSTLRTNFQTAYYLDAHPSTLAALARRGLVDRKWSEGSQRNDGRWSYRISGKGVIALSRIRKEEDRRPVILATRINDAYRELAAEPGAWVGLARIRAALADVARDDLDAALMDMVLQPGVLIDPEFNQKTLTTADREAAIHMGGEDCHLLSIGRR